ncbi:MAG: protein kinase [Candidatus Obscuribacterales bacterium]|nr:protein kinase [Candidatus Obscuribacterales bacterium]
MDEIRREEAVSSCTENCSQCGGAGAGAECKCAKSCVADPWIGTVLDDRYEILSLIDSGGMSHVYRARHKSLNIVRAVKVLRKDSLSETSLRRFEKEAKTVSSLVHSNLVGCVDFGVTREGAPYVVMEYVDGLTLSQMLRSGVVFEPARIVELMLQVCRGLHFAHRASIFHRDIKPSNLILVRDSDGNETIKILDFGIAKIQDVSEESQKLTRTGEICGSPVYMSPEQGRGMAVDERTDVYSMGCVMFELLTGNPPFVGNNAIETIMMHINCPPELGVMRDGKRVPVGLESVVLRCLEKEVDMRYRTVEELARDLESIQKGESLVGLQISRALSNSRLNRIRFATVVVLMLGWAGYSVWSSYFAENWRADLTKADSLYYDVDSAEKYLLNALKHLPKDDQIERNRAAIFMSWGRLCGSKNRIDQAKQYFEKSREAAEAYQRSSKGRGASTYLPLLADAYQGLAACDLAKGNLKQAEIEAKEAVLVRQRSFNVSLVNRMLDARLLARSYVVLGDVQAGMEKNDAALESYAAAEQIEKGYDQEQLHLSTTLEKEGIVYAKIGKKEKARDLYKRAMNIRKSVLGESLNHPAIMELQARLDALEGKPSQT